MNTTHNTKAKRRVTAVGVTAAAALLFAGAGTAHASPCSGFESTCSALPGGSSENGGEELPLIDQVQPGASGFRSIDPLGEPLVDPAPPDYEAYYPSFPVEDHVQNQARGGPDDPSNIDIKTWEANARKGGLEGAYANDLQGLINQGLSEGDAKSVLQPEDDYILNDVHARPVDPHALDSVPDQEPVSPWEILPYP
jgi:hypothetical protein